MEGKQQESLGAGSVEDTMRCARCDVRLLIKRNCFAHWINLLKRFPFQMEPSWIRFERSDICIYSTYVVRSCFKHLFFFGHLRSHQSETSRKKWNKIKNGFSSNTRKIISDKSTPKTPCSNNKHSRNCRHRQPISIRFNLPRLQLLFSKWLIILL